MAMQVDAHEIEIWVLNAIDRAGEDDAVGQDVLNDPDDGDEEDPLGTTGPI